MPVFAFAHSPLDRLANSRGKAEEVAKLRQSPDCRYIWVSGDNMRFKGEIPDFTPPETPVENILLGRDQNGVVWFAARANPGDSLKSIRDVMIGRLIPKEELSIVAQGRSVLHWHDSHAFCAKCGQPSRMEDAGYRRHCDACGADHFPRTDPVVIMAVVHGKKTLLGRQKAWAPGMYSTLAGFMEPGEMIEDAVRREVFEEVGVRLGKIDYVTSQPWPFPSSLMIGMIGEALDDALTIDENEIETARWFGAEELAQMLDHKHPEGLFASRPDAIAFTLAREALRRIS